MLLEFTVGNYRSFYEKKTLDLRAQSIKDEPKNNVFKIGKEKFLKTIAIYGANSSGKSNLIKAMMQMYRCVKNSVRLNDTDELEYEPFLFVKSSEEKQPTHFEIMFLYDNDVYRYGFEYNRDKIIEEWLYVKFDNINREKLLFVRTCEGVGIKEKVFPEGKIIDNVELNDNRLFLSLCAQLGGEISKKIIEWFFWGFNIISGIDSDMYNGFSKRMFHKKEKGSDEALAFLRKLQLGFNNIKTTEEEISVPDSMPEKIKEILLKETKGKKNILLESNHNIYNEEGNVVGNINMDFEENESAGTRKLFDFAGPIFHTLLRGSLIVIDELDAKMHPLISKQIIALFNNEETNPNNAQLIFSTHDTHLLSSNLLRRDQIWFTEKDEKEQTDLYNMMDIGSDDKKKPRSDSNYEKNYIAGRYGAVPYIINR